MLSYWDDLTLAAIATPCGVRRMHLGGMQPITYLAYSPTTVDAVSAVKGESSLHVCVNDKKSSCTVRRRQAE